jgi:class 3 adenylate cyclase
MNKIIPIKGDDNKEDVSSPRYNRLSQALDVDMDMGEYDSDDDEFTKTLDSNGDSMTGIQNINDIPIIDQIFGLGTVKDTTKFFNSLSYEGLKSSMRYFIDSSAFSFSISFDDITMIMTLFVLFADNFKIMFAPQSVDNTFHMIDTVCLFCFIFELLGSTWSKTVIRSIYPLKIDGYAFSFFWFLDLVAILSMFPDVPIVADATGMTLPTSTNGSDNYTKAGRVVRLVRLVRLVKLFKIASEKKRKQREEEELLERVRTGEVNYEEEKKKLALYDSKGSKLGTQLSDAITKKVIVIVLVMLCILPIISYTPTQNAPYFSTEMVHKYYLDSKFSDIVKQSNLNNFINEYESYEGEPYLISLIVRNSSVYDTNEMILYDNYTELISDLREGSLITAKYVSIIDGCEYTTTATFNNDILTKSEAQYAIYLTVFVGLLLVAGSVILTDDAQELVLDPIERMINLVEAVANDPMAKLEFKDSAGQSGEYETKLLQSTIEKITGLLRVGFGEAGAGIISVNLKNDTSSTINPLLPGIRVYALVGFCDIHQFEEVNLLLKSDIMTFCNSIAEIVHSSVHYWGGQCNKNLGNAFVIIWRIGDEETLHRLSNIGGIGKVSSSAHSINNITKRQHAVDLKRVPGVDVLADKALVGYLKIIAEINRNDTIMQYRNEPRLTLNGEREFKVRMGFGLHAGWAIEGAVGSLQKVDATYLSPHVNMAARLETSSRQYGVPLLASHFFHELMSPEAQDLCRKVDVVTVKGSEVPVGVYTYDSLQDQVFFTKTEKDKNNKKTLKKNTALSPKTLPSIPTDGNKDTFELPINSPQMTTEQRISISQIEPQFLTNRHDTTDVYEKDCDMVRLREHITPEFIAIFKSGLELYLDGEWPEARIKLEAANSLMKANVVILKDLGDGPCITLLNYMTEYNDKAPDSWQGFRPLTNK